MSRKKPQALPDLSTMSDKMRAILDDWLMHLSSVPDGFEAVQYRTLVTDMMSVLATHGDVIRRPESRAAMVKVLATSLCAAAYDATDEEVFALAEKVRGDLYAEVMKFRRAVSRDVRGEAQTDV